MTAHEMDHMGQMPLAAGEGLGAPRLEQQRVTFAALTVKQERLALPAMEPDRDGRKRRGTRSLRMFGSSLPPRQAESLHLGIDLGEKRLARGVCRLGSSCVRAVSSAASNVVSDSRSRSVLTFRGCQQQCAIRKKIVVMIRCRPERGRVDPASSVRSIARAGPDEPPWPERRRIAEVAVEVLDVDQVALRKRTIVSPGV